MISTRFLAALLALAIAWVSLFSLEPGQQDVTPRSDQQVALQLPAPDQGSMFDHHLDDQPLQSVDSAIDLPDHQPISRTAAALAAPSAHALPGGRPLGATVFLEGPLRPPISFRAQA